MSMWEASEKIEVVGEIVEESNTSDGHSLLHSAIKNTLTVEEAIEKMGFGPFQILITFFCGFIWLADAMELMLLSVLSPAVECKWGLSKSETATITSIVFVGFLLGGLAWGICTDAIGRKYTLLVVDINILFFGILSAIKVAPDDPTGKTFGYPWLLLCRFGVGFGAGGTAQAVTYYAEFLPKKTRGYCLVLIEFWWAVGSMFGALLALGVMNTLGWHWYLGIATLPLFFVLFLFPFVPESARFYLMKGKPDKAKGVLLKIAWFNRKTCPEGEIVSVEKKETQAKRDLVSYNREDGVSIYAEEDAPLLEDSNCEEDSPQQSKLKVCYGCLRKWTSAFRNMLTGGMWKTTVLLWILWCGCGWIYYGVVLLTTSIFQSNNHCFHHKNITNETVCGDLSNSYYVKIFWTSVAEVPGIVVTIVVIEALGRKKTMAIESIITMIGFLLLFLCSTPTVTSIFLFIIRAFATGVFQAVYVYTPEVYATNIRATALGVHTTAARIGALLTPFNAQVIYHTSDYAAIVLYAASCAVMAFASLLLPIETRGRSMTDGIMTITNTL